MNQKLIDQVKIALDERWSVVVSKDHMNGVVVQVCRLNPTTVSRSTGIMERVHQPVVMFSEIVPTRERSGEFRDPQAIQLNVAQALHAANLYAANCQAAEDETDKLLRKLNTDYNGKNP